MKTIVSRSSSRLRRQLSPLGLVLVATSVACSPAKPAEAPPDALLADTPPKAPPKPSASPAKGPAMAALETDYAPMSDMRASATYRALAARNMLRKVFLESLSPDLETRVIPESAHG